MTVRALRSAPAYLAQCTAALLIAGTACAQPEIPLAGERSQIPCALYGCIGISLGSVQRGGQYAGAPAWMNLGVSDHGNAISRIDGMDLRVIASMLLIPNFDAYARVGNRYSTPVVDGTRARNIESAEQSQEADWIYGAGVQYHFSPDWSLSADWDQYRVNLPAQREQQSVYSVGTRYRF